jgi:hypothetical protein
MTRAFHADTPLKALLLEWALLLARQLQQAAGAAPSGAALAAVEAAAVPAGRELTRQAAEAALQAQAGAAEKRGAGPRLPGLPSGRLAQAARRPQRPDGRRGRQPRAPLPGLPPGAGPAAARSTSGSG